MFIANPYKDKEKEIKGMLNNGFLKRFFLFSIIKKQKNIIGNKKLFFVYIKIILKTYLKILKTC